MTQGPTTARRLVMHGRVQGVFYRDWTVDAARSLGLTGWVCNRPDGTVEAHLEGAGIAVARMIAAMQDGPPRAGVDRIERSEAHVKGFKSFDRR